MTVPPDPRAVAAASGPPGYTPGRPVPPGYVPGQAVPPGYVPGQAVPSGYVPGQTVPPGYVPGQPVPLGYVPGQAVPPGGYAIPAVPPGYRPVPLSPAGQPLADFGSRLGAYLLDVVVLLVPALVIELIAIVPLVILLGGQLRSGEPPSPWLLFGSFAIFFVVVLGLIMLMYYLYFVTYQLRTGQTVGKRVCHITVVSAIDGAPMSRRQAVRRFFAAHASSAFAPYFNLADGFWQLWDQPLRQCLHDKCADTVVVKVGP